MNKCLAAAFVAVSLLLTPAIAGAIVPDVDSTFDVDAEGWQHQVRGGGTDLVVPPTPVAWINAGGNPGGHVRLTAPSEGLYSYWLAPDDYNGDLSLYEGGQLSFSLRSNVPMEPGFITTFPGAGHDVEIDGAGLRIYFNLPDITYAAGVWHPFVVPMQAAQWNVTGVPVTELQFQAVLADVDALRIRAEWSTAVDTDDLDSVSLVAPDPVLTGLTLSQTTTSGEVGSSHCVTATLRDAQGDPLPVVMPVVFATSGATSTAGTVPTDGGTGTATYCYDGPALPGTDTITAFADTDGDTTQDEGEPGASVVFTWTAPLSSDGCKVTLGGHVTDLSFGGNLRVRNGAPIGNLVVQEHSEDGREFRVLSVSSLSCVPATGAVVAIGTLSIDGGAPQPFRLDVTDAGEPGDADLFRLRVTGALDNGAQTLEGGNIQLH